MGGLAGTALDNVREDVQHIKDLLIVVHLLLGAREELDKAGHGAGGQ